MIPPDAYRSENRSTLSRPRQAAREWSTVAPAEWGTIERDAARLPKADAHVAEAHRPDGNGRRGAAAVGGGRNSRRPGTDARHAAGWRHGSDGRVIARPGDGKERQGVSRGIAEDRAEGNRVTWHERRSRRLQRDRGGRPNTHRTKRGDPGVAI